MVPVVLRHLEKRDAWEHPGIVDEDVDRTELVLGEPGDRVAELVGQPRLLRDLGKNFGCRFFGVPRPHKIELKMPNSIVRSSACPHRNRDRDNLTASSSRVGSRGAPPPTTH